MAFWSGWFAPSCTGCGQRIVGSPFVESDSEQKLCPTCHQKRVAERKAEIEARRADEEAARKRFEERKQFGIDPRSRS